MDECWGWTVLNGILSKMDTLVGVGVKMKNGGDRYFGYLFSPHMISMPAEEFVGSGLLRPNSNLWDSDALELGDEAFVVRQLRSPGSELTF